MDLPLIESILEKDAKSADEEHFVKIFNSILLEKGDISFCSQIP